LTKKNTMTIQNTTGNTKRQSTIQTMIDNATYNWQYKIQNSIDIIEYNWQYKIQMTKHNTLYNI
jgi:hypothetical protein